MLVGYDMGCCGVIKIVQWNDGCFEDFWLSFLFGCVFGVGIVEEVNIELVVIMCY